MGLCKTSSLGFFCAPLIVIIITLRRTFVQTRLVQQPSVRVRFWAICCEFDKLRKCQCFGFAVLLIQTILYFWKGYTQNTGNVDLLACSNYYCSKIFCRFELPGSKEL